MRRADLDRGLGIRGQRQRGEHDTGEGHRGQTFPGRHRHVNPPRTSSGGWGTARIGLSFSKHARRSQGSQALPLDAGGCRADHALSCPATSARSITPTSATWRCPTRRRSWCGAAACCFSRAHRGPGLSQPSAPRGGVRPAREHAGAGRAPDGEPQDHAGRRRRHAGRHRLGDALPHRRGRAGRSQRVWASYLGAHRPTTTTVEVSRLATHANCKIEISVIAVGRVRRSRRRAERIQEKPTRTKRKSAGRK